MQLEFYGQFYATDSKEVCETCNTPIGTGELGVRLPPDVVRHADCQLLAMTGGTPPNFQGRGAISMRDVARLVAYGFRRCSDVQSGSLRLDVGV